MLGLGYPGGPIIEKLAQNGNVNRFNLPRPLTKDKNNPYNFSFSGLKTAVRLLIDKIKSTNKSLTNKDIADICASFQKTILDIFLNRLHNVL